MRTSNPTLSPSIFSSLPTVSDRADGMTISGVVNKTAILLLLLLISAGWTWSL